MSLGTLLSSIFGSAQATATAKAQAQVTSLTAINATLTAQKAALMATVSSQALTISTQQATIASLQAQLTGGGLPTPPSSPNTGNTDFVAYKNARYVAPQTSPTGFIPSVDVARKAEVNTYLGQTIPINQMTTDLLAADLADPNTHPPVGPFTIHVIKNGWADDPTIYDVNRLPTANDIVDSGDFVAPIRKSMDFRRWHAEEGGGYYVLPTDDLPDVVINCESVVSHGELIIGSFVNPKVGDKRIKHNFARPSGWQPGVTTLLGFTSHGPSRVFGAERASALFAMDTIPAGATSVVLPGAASAGWLPDHVLCFESTDDFVRQQNDPTYTGPNAFYGPFGDGSQNLENNIHSSYPNYGGSLGHPTNNSEQVAIDHIDPDDTVHLKSALQHAHKAFTRTTFRGDVVHLLPLVHNETKSIGFESASTATLQDRAHIMLMGSGDHQWAQFELVGMGRTSNDPTLVVPYADGCPQYLKLMTADQSASIADPNNVIGRYAIHVHRSGSQSSTVAAVLRDGVVRPKPGEVDPGWGVVAHDSRVNMERLYVRGRRGAAFAWENGRENGQCVDCTAVYCPGDGFDAAFGSRAEKLRDHNGHQGVGFEMQSRQINLVRPRAIDCNVAWSYFQQTYYVTRGLVPTSAITDYYYAPDYDTLELANPLTWGNDQKGGGVSGIDEDTTQTANTYGVEQANPAIAEDFYCAGCHFGFVPNHRRFTDRADNTPYIINGFYAVGTHSPFHISSYSFVYGIAKFVIVNASRAYTGPDSYGLPGKSAFSFGDPTWLNVTSNGYVENVDILIDTAINYGGFPFDITMVNVGAVSNYTTFNSASTRKPYDLPDRDFMGPWAYPNGENTYPIKLRPDVLYQSARDFPLNLPKRSAFSMDPQPGKARPYCTTVGSATTLTWGNGANQLVFAILVSDALGTYNYGIRFNIENYDFTAANGPDKIDYLPSPATPDVYLMRNGCYVVSGAVKMPFWFPVLDRAANKIIPHLVEVDCQGFPADQVAKYQKADANALRPAWALDPNGRTKLQSLRTNAILPRDQSAPIVLSPTSFPLPENQKLLIPLRATSAYVSWALGTDSDSTQFEIAFVSGVGKVLRWKGDGTADFETPTDANHDNVYLPQLTCKNTVSGAATSYSPTITVGDVQEGNPSSFSDDFSGPAGDITTPNGIAASVWTVNDNNASGSMSRDGQGRLIAKANGVKAYIGPTLSSAQSNIEFDCEASGSNGGTVVCPTFFTNGGRCSLFYNNNRTQWFYQSSSQYPQNIDGVSAANQPATTIRMQARQTGATQITFTAFRNGTQIGQPFVVNDQTAILNGQVGLFNLLGGDAANSGLITAIRVTAVP